MLILKVIFLNKKNIILIYFRAKNIFKTTVMKPEKKSYSFNEDHTKKKKSKLFSIHATMPKYTVTHLCCRKSGGTIFLYIC